MKNVIEIKNITKKYKNFTLGEINAEIPCGFATALIGANGAGKTTLIDILCGVTAKNSGEAVYFENMTDIDDPVLRNKIGYTSSSDFFPADWNLKKISNSMELAFDNFSKEKFKEMCRRFKLEDPDSKKQKKLIQMSDGNKMRTYLASVLARDTNLLVLDEPSSSLDPLARDMLCDIFREYLAERDGERSIIFSTHNIADMEFVTDYAVFMSKGKVIEQGFVEDLKQKYILVHGDAENADAAKPYMISVSCGKTSFEGIAESKNASKLESLDSVIESPTLQQLSVGILRKAEDENEK